MSIQPDARDRADPDDFKGYLDFDGKEGQGLYSYWNLDTIEHTFAIFRNFKTADGKVAHAPITIPNQDQADQLYRKLKSIIVDACKNQKFRGGAFAEKVKETSALNDIIQFIFWSPVMTKEHRYFFRQSILAIFTQTVSRLKDTVMLGRDGFDDEYLKDYDDTLNEIKEFFQKEKDNPTPIPTDISVKWLEEFGENFTRDYKLALDLNEKGEDGAPFATAVPIRDENGLSEFMVHKY
ncbi:hypothetical protein M7I_0045 [Glarea lozoyensis 74030]|uniref:Uncharacterized protein n=1 Tax=Glarea lozoyensis (strain ATCC 74030 / MF5533) TaxID=1104152 RepID=H0ECB1_GLAL7|nr:hypothetical protein M7I_0045 [Glarea lozoyensis 74030]